MLCAPLFCVRCGSSSGELNVFCDWVWALRTMLSQHVVPGNNLRNMTSLLSFNMKPIFWAFIFCFPGWELRSWVWSLVPQKKSLLSNLEAQMTFYVIHNYVTQQFHFCCLWLFCFWDRISIYSSGWPWIHGDLPASQPSKCRDYRCARITMPTNTLAFICENIARNNVFLPTGCFVLTLVALGLFFIALLPP